jgi:hypothetical protein
MKALSMKERATREFFRKMSICRGRRSIPLMVLRGRFWCRNVVLFGRQFVRIHRLKVVGMRLFRNDRNRSLIRRWRRRRGVPAARASDHHQWECQKGNNKTSHQKLHFDATIRKSGVGQLKMSLKSGFERRRQFASLARATGPIPGPSVRLGRRPTARIPNV